MELNEHYEESKKVIERWAAKKNNAYIKQPCGADEGCIYDLTDDKSGISMKIDIGIMQEGALVFEAFPGIIVQNDILTPAIARYTQEKILSRLGMVNVNMRTKEIVYHCETLIKENTITEATLTKLEEDAVHDKDKGNNFLIHGHLHHQKNISYEFIKNNIPCALNAGVEINGYKPVAFEDLFTNNSIHYEREVACSK